MLHSKSKKMLELCDVEDRSPPLGSTCKVHSLSAKASGPRGTDLPSSVQDPWTQWLIPRAKRAEKLFSMVKLRLVQNF